MSVRHYVRRHQRMGMVTTVCNRLMRWHPRKTVERPAQVHRVPEGDLHLQALRE